MSSNGEPRLPVSSIFQGGYEILAELGTGSYGRVYKARQLSTSQEVAIKILRLRPDDGVADVGVQTDRFRREMHLCAGLAHPNIVRLIDSGESDEAFSSGDSSSCPGRPSEQSSRKKENSGCARSSI